MNPKAIPDEKEISNKETYIFSNKAKEFKEKVLSSEICSMIPELTSLIQHIDTTILDDYSIKLLIESMETISSRLSSLTSVDKDKAPIYLSLFKSLLKKAVELFCNPSKSHLGAKSIKFILKHNHLLLFEKARSFFGGSSEPMPTPLYLDCLNFLKVELKNHCKLIWKLTLPGILQIFEMFNYLELSRNMKIDISQLYEDYFTELISFFQSGRPELKDYAVFEKLTILTDYIQRSLRNVVKKDQYELLIPVLSKTLITSGNRLTGIKLLNTFCRRAYDYYYSSLAEKVKEWMNKNDIYELVLCPAMSEHQYDESKSLLRYFGRGTGSKDKNGHLIKLLKENNSKNKWIVKFCMKEIEIYGMTLKDKLDLVAFIGSQEDLCSNYPDYNDCLDDIIYRLDYYSSQELTKKVFELLLKVVKNSSHLSDLYKRKLMNNIRGTSKYLKSMMQKYSTEEKVQTIKKLIDDLLKTITPESVLLFNSIIIDSDLKRAFSNNPFQSIMNFVIEDLHFFERIFDFLESDQKIGDLQEIVKAIQFVSSKSSVKIDVTQKYLKTLANFPDLYECLIANEGYSKVKGQMEAVLDLFRSQPKIPFHLLKTTFKKANFKYFSEYSKQPSLLSYKKEESNLKYKPSQLEWYEEIISLLEETQNSALRKEIAEFIVSLHLNYSNHHEKEGDKELRSYIDSIIEYFHQNSKSYNSKTASARSMSANIQLVIQMMKFTDILGVGQYSPHKSLVPTSTIPLTFLNNITFGDDVIKTFSRNFPANMVLFDVLTLIGLSFKSGPEDLVLRQGSRFIPITNNGCVLQDLGFTSEQVVVEKNESNYLKPPEIIVKNQEKQQQFAEVYVKCLREVFDRFSFQGKMSQIEAVNYLRQASGAYVMSYDRRVREMFEDFDKDNDGILNLTDFLNYNLKSVTSYTFSSNYYKEQFIKGLVNLRYRKNMTLYNQPLDISNRYPSMMRVKLLSCPEIYEVLFVLAEDENKEVREQSRQLLLNLPTCPAMQEHQQTVFDFKGNSSFLTYYKLIMIEFELENNSSVSKAEKITVFIDKKYNQIIFELLTHFYQNLELDQYSFKNFSLCLKILRSLIDVGNLTSVKVWELSFDPLSVHSLPNSTFFVKEALKALQNRNVINFQVLLVLQLTQESIDFKTILEGCFHQEQEMRKVCCNFLFLWEEKVRWKDNLFSIALPERRSREFFELLCAIIVKTKMNQSMMQQILENTVKSLESREETIYNRENEGLRGYLNILKTMIQTYPMLMQSPLVKTTVPKLLEKTISEQTRSILYAILIDLDDILVVNYLKEMISTVLPSQQCEVRSEYMGLRNLGATCYLNSILQQFFMIKKFRDLLLSSGIPDDCKKVQVDGKVLVDDFMYQLQKMYYHLQFGQKKYFIPKEFCYSYKDFDGKPINTTIQEDSHQFLNRLIEQVEASCSKNKLLKILQQICEVKTLTEIECEECKHKIDRIENHYSCMLEVKEQDSLASSLKKFTEKDQIQGYRCEKCNQAKSISKRTYLYDLPDIIILNLQRIIFDPKKGDKIKVHSSLTFPTDLDLAQYIKNPEIDQLNTKYRLKGVVIHTGTSEGGHYYSLIKDNSKDRWLKFNDQNVVEFDPKEIPRQAFGGFETKDSFEEVTYSTNAYILFYESVSVQPQQFCEVENVLSEEVHQENSKLIKEVQVHQECFFTSINTIYQRYRFNNIQKSLKSQPFAQNVLKDKNMDIYPLLLDLHQRAFSFLSVFTSLKSQCRKVIANNLIQLYHVIPDETLTFFKEINISTFIENLISHNDKTYRESLRKIFAKNTQIYIEYFGVTLTMDREEDGVIKELLDSLLSHLSNKIFYSSISKSQSFFGLLEDLCTTLPVTRTYLAEKQLLFYLLDLLMGRESPFIKHHPKAQDLPDTAVAGIYPIILTMFRSKINFKGHHLNKAQYAPFLETSPLQKQIIFSKTFYKRIFRRNYDHQVLTGLINLYSFQDLEYTAMISEILLQQMNKLEQPNPELQCKRLQSILGMKDGLEYFRYGALLGIPQNVNHFGHFCLRTNDQSDHTFYMSGLCPSKTQMTRIQNNKTPLLQIIFCEKIGRSQTMFVLLCIKLLLALAEGSEKFFNYLMSVTPPNYTKMTLFDVIPDITAQITADKDFVVEPSLELITTISNYQVILQEKIKEYPKKLPVKPDILGKTTDKQKVDLLKDDNLNVQLTLFWTYILPNEPTGSENKSMGKQFSSYDVKGIANLFVDYRSDSHYQPKEKVNIKPTTYNLDIVTKQRYLFSCLRKETPYQLILTQGEFSINLPFLRKEEKIKDIFEITAFNQQLYEAPTEVVDEFFKVQKVEMKSEAEVSGDEAKVEQQKNQKMMAEDKIECPRCTMLNELTNDRCEICDSLLYE